MQAALNNRVQQLIGGLVESGAEVSLQVAVYLDGELAVDTWAGVADETTGRPVAGDTLFTSWSTTKGFVATCIHLLADRGQLQYDSWAHGDSNVGGHRRAGLHRLPAGAGWLPLAGGHVRGRQHGHGPELVADGPWAGGIWSPAWATPASSPWGPA